MKTIIALALCCLVIAVSGAEEKYTSRFDNVDVDNVLSNERLLKSYLNCLLDNGKCNADAKELKKLLPDALQTECTKCTEKQKVGAEKVIKFLSEKKPEEWQRLLEKYDQDGSYRAKHSEEAKKHGVKV